MPMQLEILGKKRIQFENTLEFSKTNHWILLRTSLDVKLASRWHDPAPQLSVVPKVNEKRNQVQPQSGDP